MACVSKQLRRESGERKRVPAAETLRAPVLDWKLSGPTRTRTCRAARASRRRWWDHEFYMDNFALVASAYHGLLVWIHQFDFSTPIRPVTLPSSGWNPPR